MSTKNRYLTAQEVIAINVAMIQRYSPGEQIGVKSSSLLESAIHRPLSSAFGEDAYPTIWNKAAALFESLGQNHPFQNANKRTAFTALLIFLRYNGYHFKMNPKAAEDFTVDMVNHKYAFEELASIIERHSVKIP
ncbi:type II toxin-antitoxin system death-on-curing family toxin [Paenibacillus chitinolyticus]|uniref:type II toxin-antitoxin system death-on-curing family toxin n=1 Tax=Paenibacillus chitinolyticus TaxID=79263 RepID=UPI002DB60646|nr:type II toxin-antitoxin system death-on-curing family toxin [Paenibacillus chitinolyticus]MEC0246532.1 type II toxin-antitoxin system death-on-curing family toxin [Paenibacillus chitinolyticus]